MRIMIGDTKAHPVIGLTARTLALPAARQTRPTETVARSYVAAVTAAGGLPVLLPNLEPAAAPACLDLLDGLLLTGGDDPHPHLFGEEAHPNIDVVDAVRDEFEIALLEGARGRRLPVFGVCRGIQILNIARGGDIYQDIPAQTDSAVQHTQKRLDDGPWHEIEIPDGTLLGRLLGAGTRSVNSFHHQACRKVGDGLAVSARTGADGLIEALEDPDQPFCLAVQWHPELADDAEKAPLFAGFLAAAREYAAASSKGGRTVPSSR